MDKDYSEYEYSSYQQYEIMRSNANGVIFDYFDNDFHYNDSKKIITISVDDRFEYASIRTLYESVDKMLMEKEGVSFLDDEDEDYTDELKENEELFNSMKSKYNIRQENVYEAFATEYNFDDKIHPLNNVLSGCNISLNIGEGILDFIYADFDTPCKKAYRFASMFSKDVFDSVREKFGFSEPPKEKSESKPEKIYSIEQEIVDRYFAYTETCVFLKEVSQSSLYSMICPPVITAGSDKQKAIKWYFHYLKMLQEEYKDILEFCFDDTFFPEVLGDRYPSERYRYYRRIKNQPHIINRREKFAHSHKTMSGSKMPYGLSIDELKERFSADTTPTEVHKAFAEKYNMDANEVALLTNLPCFIYISHTVSTIAEALEYELTKMLEYGIRFRKCKRCGRYFIMKGNYDTNYCDRIAEGETRNCQDIMALENYKKKMADNAAIGIYNKYYKRYSARVKAHTILEKDFKKWKYEAITKRDECIDGIITEQEYIAWLESCFPNRQRKHE